MIEMNKTTKKGFTLIEAMVSISIFIVVMVVSATALLSIINANQKSHQLKSVIDNLNFALENMARNIRVGTVYQCGGGLTSCTNPPNTASFSYIPQTSVQRRTYSLVTNPTGGYEIGQQSGSGALQILTDPQVHINDLRFYVVGAAIGQFAGGSSPGGGDGQPHVVITVTGYAGTGKVRSDFHLQTSVTQRIYDY